MENKKVQYLINIINDMDLKDKFSKYKLVMFAMAKIMEMTKEEQNQVALFLFNAVILEFNMKKTF